MRLVVGLALEITATVGVEESTTGFTGGDGDYVGGVFVEGGDEGVLG